MSGLPIILESEPLIDAIFEVRLSGASQLTEVLPGLLFSGSADRPSINRLPPADIPQPMRAQDANLSHAPIVKIEFGQYTVSVGDRNFIIGCKLPYPKWPAFKGIILSVIQQIVDSGLSAQIHRFSLKYVNLVEASSIEDQLSKVQLDVKVGSHEIRDRPLLIRTELLDNDAIHIISITSGAKAKFHDGHEAEGIVVDVDSIRNAAFQDFTSFQLGLDEEIEQLRQANKAHFFDCLTSAAIQEMGPKYE